MANYQLYTLKELEGKEVLLDSFIVSTCTNGEFINTFSFLSYHQEGKFQDDSTVVLEVGSGTICGVMMAAVDPRCSENIVSHPGTSFAGPVISRKTSISDLEKILSLFLNYYKERYKKISIKTAPFLYGIQPFGVIEYFLLKNNFTMKMAGLSNIIDIRHLRNREDILRLFDSKKRNQVKKVIQGQLFKAYEGSEISESVWGKMTQNLKNKYDVLPTHSWEEINLLRNRFIKEIIPYYVDTLEGEYGAFGLAFKYKKVFHTQYLDTNYAFSGQYPNLLLVLYMMEQAIAMGYDYFSFGVSTEKMGEYLNIGLYNYKAGYGGGDIVFPIYQWIK